MDEVGREVAQLPGSEGSSHGDGWPPELHVLYNASRESYVRMASVLLGRRVEAEEVVQEAFVAAARHAHGVENLPAYVRRTVINGAYGVLRRRQLGDRTTVDPPPPQAPDHLIEFRDVLLKLPWNQRAVIVLRFLEGLSVRETAEIIGCRESTVRSHSRRGLKSLRKDLTP